MYGLRYCLCLYAKNPAAFQAIRDVLVLPSPLALRLERNKGGVVQPGIQLDLSQRLTCAVAKVEHAHERMAVMIIDEMTVKVSFVCKLPKVDLGLRIFQFPLIFSYLTYHGFPQVGFGPLMEKQKTNWENLM